MCVHTSIYTHTITLTEGSRYRCSHFLDEESKSCKAQEAFAMSLIVFGAQLGFETYPRPWYTVGTQQLFPPWLAGSTASQQTRRPVVFALRPHVEIPRGHSSPCLGLSWFARGIPGLTGWFPFLGHTCMAQIFNKGCGEPAPEESGSCCAGCSLSTATNPARNSDNSCHKDSLELGTLANGIHVKFLHSNLSPIMCRCVCPQNLR